MSKKLKIVFSSEKAARIARRVTALDGLSDDALDGGWNFKDYKKFVVNLEKQRKELLEALEQLAAIVDIHQDNTNNSFAWPELALARQAIAKAKGQPCPVNHTMQAKAE